MILWGMVLASSISTMALVMAPGPQIIGMASGVMEMSLTYAFTSDFFTLVCTSLALSMSRPIMKKITPPTIRKLFTEMPKNLKSSCPEKANARMVISAAMVAFLAVRVRSASSRVEVMVIKMVIVPNGLMRVKNEVKAKRPKASSSLFMGLLFGGL